MATPIIIEMIHQIYILNITVDEQKVLFHVIVYWGLSGQNADLINVVNLIQL